MKRVILESPYKGKNKHDEFENIYYARECMRDCLSRGESPSVSHLLYTQVLDDNIPEQRKLGMEAGQSWYEVADYCVVYTDFGISEGMQEGIKKARICGLEIIERKLYA